MAPTLEVGLLLFCSSTSIAYPISKIYDYPSRVLEFAQIKKLLNGNGFKKIATEKIKFHMQLRLVSKIEKTFLLTWFTYCLYSQVYRKC